MSFSNKVVLVIGASSGIGAATAIEFAKEGADVVLVGRNTVKLNKVAENCEKHGKKPLLIKADITKDDEVVHMMEETMKKLGKLDVLINNAGMASPSSILNGNLLKSYDITQQTNLRGLIHITQLAAPHLIKTKGNIINISSVITTCPPAIPVFVSYAISKAGLDQFTKYAAAELAAHGVRVNAVSPGPVITDFAQNCGAGSSDNNIKINTPLNRISESNEVADLILFLASDKAKAVTGSIYVTDNGFSLSSSLVSTQ